MTENSVPHDLLDQLADSFVERYRRGERPSLSEYADRHPELADEIEEIFTALVMMEQVDEEGLHACCALFPGDPANRQRASRSAVDR